jgi:hypothetical protein
MFSNHVSAPCFTHEIQVKTPHGKTAAVGLLSEIRSESCFVRIETVYLKSQQREEKSQNQMELTMNAEYCMVRTRYNQNWRS